MCIINDIVNGIVIQTSCACLYKYLNRFNLLSLPRYGCHELNRNVKCNIIALKGSVLHVLLSRIYCITTNENWNIILYFISDYILSINTNWICNIKMLFKSTFDRLSNSNLPCGLCIHNVVCYCIRVWTKSITTRRKYLDRHVIKEHQISNWPFENKLPKCRHFLFQNMEIYLLRFMTHIVFRIIYIYKRLFKKSSVIWITPFCKKQLHLLAI